MVTSNGAGERTVAFFRVAARNADGPIQFPEQDWQTVLGNVAGLDFSDRIYQGPSRRLIGEVITVDQDYALKLMEPRDENSWLEATRSRHRACESA